MNQTIFTIGFTKKTAEQFFSQLAAEGVRRVVDTRLNNRSQLAGFAKQDDLKYFLRAIAGIEYVHAPLLAPTQDMLDTYKKGGGAWADYQARFLDLIAGRNIETHFSRDELDASCLLCSEHQPQYCHRRLVAEYLRQKWGEVDIRHLT